MTDYKGCYNVEACYVSIKGRESWKLIAKGVKYRYGLNLLISLGIGKDDIHINRPSHIKKPIIYFIKCGDHIKIGRTTNSLSERLQTIQIYNAEPVKYHFAYYGKHEDEPKTHKMFASDRVRGEWFRHSDSIESHIQKLKNTKGIKIPKGTI